MRRKHCLKCIVYGSALIAVDFLRKSCNALICPAYPVGIFGANDDIQYAALTFYSQYDVIVGGSCKDISVCPGSSYYPAPIIQKVLLTSLQFTWSVVLQRGSINSVYDRVINIDYCSGGAHVVAQLNIDSSLGMLFVVFDSGNGSYLYSAKTNLFKGIVLNDSIVYDGSHKVLFTLKMNN